MDNTEQIKNIIESVGSQLNKIVDIVKNDEGVLQKKIWSQSEEIKSLNQRLEEAGRKFDEKEKSEEYVFKKYNVLKNAVSGTEVLESLSYEISKLMIIASDPNNPVKSLKQIVKKMERNLESLGAKIVFSEAGSTFSREIHDAEFIDTGDTWKHMKVKESVSAGFSFSGKRFGEENDIKEKVTVWRGVGTGKKEAEPVQNGHKPVHNAAKGAYEEEEERFYYYIVFDGEEELIGYKIKNKWNVSYDFSNSLLSVETDNVRVIVTEEKDMEPLFEFKLIGGHKQYKIEKLKFSMIENRTKIEAVCQYAYFNGDDVPVQDSITLCVPAERTKR